MTLMEICQTLSGISGVKAPSMHLPYTVAYMAGWFNTKLSLAFGKTPTISLEGVKMAKKKMWVECTKAIKELGLPQTPPEEALSRAVAWYYDNGYVPGVRKAALVELPVGAEAP